MFEPFRCEDCICRLTNLGQVTGCIYECTDDKECEEHYEDDDSM